MKHTSAIPRRLLIPASLALAFSANLLAQSHMTRHDLESRIEDIVTATPGTFGVAFKDLRTGETYFRDADTTFHAASTMKTPLMVEVFRQAGEGRFSLDDSLEVRNAFYSLVDGSPYTLNKEDDSDSTLYALAGRRVPIRHLMERMIVRSSNFATNLLMELVTADSVRKTMRQYGAVHLNILRGVEDGKAFEAGMNNTTTPRDLLIVFEHIARGEAVSPEASREMIGILLHQELNEMIPALLPKDVRVAHKTGSITGVEHDSGIIMLPDGRRYALVVLSKNLRKADEGINAIARISQVVYEYEIR